MREKRFLCDALINSSCWKATCWFRNPFRCASSCRCTTDQRFAIRDADGMPIEVPPDMTMFDLREEMWE